MRIKVTSVTIEKLGGRSTQCFGFYPFVTMHCHGESPHSRFLTFTRRSSHGKSLPKWMSEPGPVLLRKFVRTSKNDDMVQRVELLEANPMYALVKYPDGRESNVSLRDLAPLPLARESTMADDTTTRVSTGRGG